MNIHSLIEYFKYQRKAKDEHSLHSPFMFDFYVQVIKPDKHYYVFDDIEEIRAGLLTNKAKITVTDFGAGSKAVKGKERQISAIAKHSLSRAKTSRLLFKIIEYFNPKVIFELGTCFGINTLYLTLAYKDSQVLTFEGCPNLSMQAKNFFEKLKVTPKIIQGNLDISLYKILNSIPIIDFIFFDANHKFKPTIKYFEACLPKASQDAVFVFDDIHWSPSMTRAWNVIKNRPEVTLSVDLFQVGIVFFRKVQPKQHFVLKF